MVDAKIPFFGPFTGAEALREPFHKSVFHLRASYYDETALIVRNLTSLGLKKIAVFYQNDAYGMAGLEGVKRALKAQGLAPVALGTVERNTVNVAKAVKDICPSLPDAVVQTLHRAFLETLGNTNIRAKLSAAGYDPAPPASASEFALFIRDQVAFWGDLVKASGVSID